MCEWLHECYCIGGEETGHFFMHTIFISLWDVTAIQYTFLGIFGLNIRTKRTTHEICYKSRKSDSTRYQNSTMWRFSPCHMQNQHVVFFHSHRFRGRKPATCIRSPRMKHLPVIFIRIESSFIEFQRTYCINIRHTFAKAKCVTKLNGTSRSESCGPVFLSLLSSRTSCKLLLILRLPSPNLFHLAHPLDTIRLRNSNYNIYGLKYI